MRKGSITFEFDDLRLETEPAPQDIRFLEDQINAFNFDQAGIRDGRLLASLVGEDSRQVVEGIYGWTWGGCCEIQYLWVQRELSGRGYVSRLSMAAEQGAQLRGCTQVVLDTHSFQAPQFYQKFGYEIVGIVEDYPHDEQKLCLKESLR